MKNKVALLLCCSLTICSITVATVAMPAFGSATGEKDCGLSLQEIVDPYFLSGRKGESAGKNTIAAHRLMALHARLQLEGFLDAKGSLAEKVDNMADGDLRRHVFVIEALLRLFKGSDEFAGKDRKRVRQALKLTTALEDQLGDYTDTIEHIKSIKKIRETNPKKNGVSDDILAAIQSRFEKDQVKQKRIMMAFLKDQGWVGKGKSVKLVRDAMEAVTQLRAEESREVILSTMISYLEKTEDRIEDVLADNAVDFERLEKDGKSAKWLRKFRQKVEEQVHPPRRWLRWFSLMVQSSNMFKLQDGKNPVPEFKGLNVDPVALEKYGKIEVVGVLKNPVYLNKHLYLAYIELISELGSAKEFGQFEESVIRALQKEGMTDDEAIEQASKVTLLYPGYFAPFKAAYRDLKLVRDSNLLGLTIKALNKQH